MRERFCKNCRQWHDLDEPWPVQCMSVRQTPRSDLAAPMVVMDTMEPVQSMLDGKMYTSKSALRATYKQAGVNEVGNDSSILDPKPRAKPRPNRKEIKETVDKAFSQAGYGA